jgi:hypothetical protein
MTQEQKERIAELEKQIVATRHRLETETFRTDRIRALVTLGLALMIKEYDELKEANR